MKQYRYEDFVKQQRAGSINGVFIDDTGSPGLHGSPGLNPYGKSWVAVIISKLHLAEVWHQMPKALDELKTQTGAEEFHLTNIYAGRGEFKNVSLDVRLALFEFMVRIFTGYRFPVLVQTLDPNLLANIRSRAPFPEQLGAFDLTKPEDFALFFLLLRVKWYVEENFVEDSRLTRVFIDEGFKKNGIVLGMPFLEDVFADGLICFGRSDSILPIQLADFAAFCLNRTQLISGKTDPSDLDLTFLEIVEPMTKNFKNIPTIRIDEWFSKKSVH